MNESRKLQSTLGPILKASALGLVLAMATVACAPKPVLKPVEMAAREFVVPCSEKETLAGVERFARSVGFTVAARKGDAGPILLEDDAPSLEQLDTFCDFPLRDKKTGEPVANFWEWKNWWSEDIHDARAKITVTLGEKGSDKTSVAVKSDWGATVSDYNYSEKPKIPYELNSNGVFEASLQRSLVAACSGKPGPDLPGEMTALTERLKELRDSYENGEIPRKEYPQERNQVMADFQQSLG